MSAIEKVDPGVYAASEGWGPRPGARARASGCLSVAGRPARPPRLGMQLGVSCARITPLPSALVTNASRSSSTLGPVVGVLMSSTSVM